jgi:MSHA biogenesis protein MshO
MRPSRPSQHGFTLIELVISISVSAVVLIFVVLFLGPPIDSYFTQTRRADLLNAQVSAWRPMEADIRQAVPNSARTRPNGLALEVLLTLDSARYMGDPSAGANFTIAGILENAGRYPGTATYASIDSGPPARPAGPYTPGVIARITGLDAAQNVATGRNQITVAPPAGYGAGTARRRVYLSTPVTYLCNPAQRTIRRYEGYTFNPNHAARDSDAELVGAGAASRLVARNITACTFSTTPITPNRPQVAMARITATRDADPANVESITLLHQAGLEMLQ